ncbi:MAG TPA: transposase [Acidimicrobiales bacterium]
MVRRARSGLPSAPIGKPTRTACGRSPRSPQGSSTAGGESAAHRRRWRLAGTAPRTRAGGHRTGRGGGEQPGFADGPHRRRRLRRVLGYGAVGPHRRAPGRRRGHTGARSPGRRAVPAAGDPRGPRHHHRRWRVRRPASRVRGASGRAHSPPGSGSAPGHHESAGKRCSGKAREGNPALRTAMCEAAWAASHGKDTYLAAQYRRFKRKFGTRGETKAVFAVAHTMIVIVWHLLADPEATYEELGADFFDRRSNTEARQRQLIRHPRTRSLTRE